MRTSRAAAAPTPKFVAVFYANGVPEVGTFDAGTRSDFGMNGPYEGFALPDSGSDMLKPGYYLTAMQRMEEQLIVLDGLNGATKGDYHKAVWARC